jgi:hypothetical protein
VYGNLEQAKISEKAAYDKLHSTKPVDYLPGSLVLLQDKRVKPRSDSVVTHRPYKGPYYVEKKIEESNIGPAYSLIDAKNGRRVKSLIASHRLKPYTQSKRLKFDLKNPKRVSTHPLPEVDSHQHEIVRPNDGFEPALKIIKQRRLRGRLQYLVLFANRESYWCDEQDVTEPLVRFYRLRHKRKRKKRT